MITSTETDHGVVKSGKAYADDAYQQQNSIMAIGSGQTLGQRIDITHDIASVKNGNFIVRTADRFYLCCGRRGTWVCRLCSAYRDPVYF